MLETPLITQSTPQPAAVIHLTIPRDRIRTIRGPESDPDPSIWRTELNQPLLG